MRTLLARLGDPQLRYEAVHVVGTNGKSTTTRLTEALLADAGLRVGAYLSPHVRGWSERIRIGGAEADFEQAVARVRPHADGATQFEVVTAAALLAFADAEVDVAVVEAGLGGRHDATNVLRTRSSCSRTSRSTTWTCSATRARRSPPRSSRSCSRAARSSSAIPSGRSSRARTARAVVDVAGSSNLALAVAAAQAFLGAEVDPHAAQDVSLPGRLERRSEEPLEIWDGAHNLAGVGYLLPRLPDREYVVVCSILADKRPELMLEALSVLGPTLDRHGVLEFPGAPGRGPRSPRRTVLPACRGRSPIPVEARSRALELAGPQGAVVVTGSLYLLAELNGHGTDHTHKVSEKLSVFAFAAGISWSIVGGAFAAGYLIGRILL